MSVGDFDPAKDMRLQAGEQVVEVYRRSGWPMALAKIVTLGLFIPWWRACIVVISDQRVFVKKGILNKHELSLPMKFIQDASMHRSWLGVGSVVVSTAGRTDGDAVLSPFSPVDARRVSDGILAQAKLVAASAL